MSRLARARLGPEPLAALFAATAGPLATPAISSVVPGKEDQRTGLHADAFERLAVAQAAGVAAGKPRACHPKRRASSAFHGIH